jgi:hypothetical protein
VRRVLQHALAVRRPQPGVLEPDADQRVIRGMTRSHRPGVPLYASATAIAFASPIASVARFGAIALFYMLSPARFD